MKNNTGKPKFAGLLSRAMSGLWGDVSIVASAIRQLAAQSETSRLNYRTFREKWTHRPPVSNVDWRLFWREFFDLEGAEDDRGRTLSQLSSKLVLACEKAREIIANNDRANPDVFASIQSDIIRLEHIIHEAKAMYQVSPQATTEEE